MIDPSFDGEVATITPYPPTIQELETEISRLESELDAITSDRDFWQARAHDRQMMIDNLEEYVKDQFDYIDEEISQSLVDIFGLNISKDYDVTVTVTFSGTVSVPLNYDMDDLADSLNSSLEFSYYEDGEADLSENRMEIDWAEA